jgi:hypothetical protein
VDGIGIFGGPASSNRVLGNIIGADATGASFIPNGGSGVVVGGSAADNRIGQAGAGNLIVFNSGSGVAIYGDAGTSNAISSNTIHDNGGLGIDLGSDGVTPNDLFDLDSGPNNLQNFVVFTGAKSKGANTVISGTLASTANRMFRIEFFSNPSCDDSGYGEGRSFLGFANLKTNAAGRLTFSVPLAGSDAVAGRGQGGDDQPRTRVSDVSGEFHAGGDNEAV